ncbi:hypothetical protein ES703_63951 [subsurface metagenome]
MAPPQATGNRALVTLYTTGLNMNSYASMFQPSFYILL